MNQNINEIIIENWKLIKSNNSIFKIKNCFDSRPTRYSKKKIYFNIFYGVEIFENNFTNKNKVTLMDFQKFNNNYSLFMYFFIKKRFI